MTRADAATMVKQRRSRNLSDTELSDSCPEWIVGIQLTLGCVNINVVKACSIWRVSEKIREVKDKDSYNYRPKWVAIGPIHRGTRSDLQIMEDTKWRFMYKLLSRPTEKRGMVEAKTIESCSESIGRMESVIRESYVEKIEKASEELARNMLLDACFLLELLIRLSENTETDRSDLDHIIYDKKKMVRVLTDLTLLENQIPFLLLTVLSSELLNHPEAAAKPQELKTLFDLSQDKTLSPQKLAESHFVECDVAGAGPDFSKGVYHLLHLIHLCYPDPYPQHHEHRKASLQLLRCARKLQAFGITIKASQTNHSIGNNKAGTLASALTEFVDKFEFKIEFNETQRELIIPTLHMKEATEAKWRNFIAWEQIGLIGVGYKFTSYAYFFKSLVCSVHDVQLLREAGVIKLLTEINDKDLLIMFQSIATGAKLMDGRYRDLCEELNKANVKGVAGWCVLILKMAPHYWRRFLGWLQRGLISMLLGLISMLRSFIHIYLGTPWKFIGVLSGTVLLVLTIMQTIYAARSSR